MENLNKPSTVTHNYPKTSQEMIDDIAHTMQLHYNTGNCRVECYDDIMSMLRELQEISVF